MVGAQRRKPQDVYWPSYFVSADGSLLSVGSFEPGETPLNCISADFPEAQPPQELLDCAEVPGATAHLTARQAAVDRYLCYWQELVAPDNRPYYYDYVSHTWSFSRPLNFTIGADNPNSYSIPEANEQAPIRSDWLALHTLQSCFPEVCEPPDTLEISTAGRSAAPTPYAPSSTHPFGCQFCGKGFKDEWSLEQHLYSKAGEPPHPPIPTAPAAAPFGAAVPSPTAPTMSDRPLDPVDDVEEGCDQQGKTYWYNPRTRVSSWSREEVIARNRAFYYGIIKNPVRSQAEIGPGGQLSFWARRHLSGWSLEELYKKYEADTTSTS